MIKLNFRGKTVFSYLFRVYIAFNTVKVRSRWVVLWAEGTSTYGWSRFSTKNCQLMTSNYQLSHLRSGREPNPDLGGGGKSVTALPLWPRGKTVKIPSSSYIYLFGVLRRFQHCTDHIMTGSWAGRGNQYIQFVRVLFCKLPTNGKQLPAFPLEAMPGTKPRPQR